MTLPKNQSTISILTVVGVVLGGVLGYFVPAIMSSISIVGQLFLNALQIVFIPLVVSAVIIGVSSLGAFRKLGRVLASVLTYFIGTTAAAVVIGIILTVLIRPGAAINRAEAFVPEMVTRARATGIDQIYEGFIPSNLFQAVSEGQFIGLIVFAIVFGAVLATMGKQAGVVEGFFRGVFSISMKIVSFLIYVAPIGLFVLVGSAVAGNPQSVVTLADNFGLLAVTVLVGFLIHGLLLLPLILRVMGHTPPGAYFHNLVPALSTAFGTASSAAALPITYTGVVEKSEVDRRAGTLVLPLGAAMNLNGTAMYLVIASLFIAQVFGVSLSVFQVVGVAVLAVIVSLGAGGVPGTTLFMLAILLSSARFPNEVFAGIGLLVAVDWLFDRARAVLNVWSDAVGAAVVAETFEFKTARVRGARSTAETVQEARKGRPSREYPRKRGADPDRDSGSRRSDTRRDDKSRRRDQRREGRSIDKPSKRPSPPKERAGSRSKEEPAGADRVSRGRAAPDKSEKPTRQSIPIPPLPQSARDEKAAPTRPEKEKERATAEESATSAGQESIQEERSRIATEFAVKRQAEERQLSDTEIEEPTEPAEAEETEDTEDTFDESLKPGQVEAPDLRETNEQPEEADEERETELEYGRRLNRRKTARPESDESEPAETEEADLPKPVDSYSAEEMSFGRKRRKRTR